MAGTMPASLEDLLMGTREEGRAKTASPASRPVGSEETSYATELAMLDKFAQEHFTQDDMLKIAASAKISGDIIADIQIEKFASVAPVIVKLALEQVLPHILPGLMAQALHKIAVGDSDVISGDRPSDTVEAPPHDQTKAEADKDNEGGPAKVDSLTHANETVGASGDGAKNPESKQGKPTENTHGNTVGKMATLNPNMLQQVLNQRLATAGMPGTKRAMPGAMPDAGGMGGGMDPEQLVQQLLAKQQSGQPLSPEEQELLQQLMGAGGMGGMGGMGGGMERQASVHAMTPGQKAAAFEAMLARHVG